MCWTDGNVVFILYRLVFCVSRAVSFWLVKAPTNGSISSSLVTGGGGLPYVAWSTRFRADHDNTLTATVFFFRKHKTTLFLSKTKNYLIVKAIKTRQGSGERNPTLKPVLQKV